MRITKSKIAFVLYILLIVSYGYSHARDDTKDEEIKQRSVFLDKFLSKKDFDYIISDMKDSINAIWIITASCNIIAI